MSDGEEGRVIVPGHVQARRFDDELVILDLVGGNYFALNEVGAEMWDALSLGQSPDQVADALARRYDAVKDVVLADCLRLIDELVSRKLLRRAAAP